MSTQPQPSGQSSVSAKNLASAAQALGEIEGPSREGFLDVQAAVPEERLADIAGCSDLLPMLQEISDDITAYTRGDQDVELPRGVLLFGSGGGMSLITRALAGESGARLVSVSTGSLIGSGNPLQELEKVFNAARSQHPSEQTGSAESDQKRVNIVHISDLDLFFEDGPPQRVAFDRQVDSSALYKILSEISDRHDQNGSRTIVVGSANMGPGVEIEFLHSQGFERPLEVFPPESTAQRLTAVKSIFDAKYSQRFKLEDSEDTVNFGKLCSGLTVGGISQVLGTAVQATRRRGETTVEIPDLLRAYKIESLGYPRQELGSEADRHARDVHEVGHAIMAHFTGVKNILISNAAWGRIGGMVVPDYSLLEGSSRTKQQGLKNLLIGFGGISAERVALGDLDVTEGAGNDFYQNQTIAQRMISSGMFPEKFEPMMMDRYTASPRESHFTQLGSLLQNARTTSEKVLNAVSKDTINEIAAEIRELGEDLFGERAIAFFDARFEKKVVTQVESTLRRYYKDPLGDGGSSSSDSGLGGVEG